MITKTKAMKMTTTDLSKIENDLYIKLKIHDKTSISQKSRQEEIEYPDNVNLYCPNYLTGLTKKDLKNIRKTMRL